MAPDLLSTIRREIDERLNELRPLLAEHEQLLVAADALVARGHEVAAMEPSALTPASGTRREELIRPRRRGSAAGVKRAAAGPAKTAINGQIDLESAKSLDAAGTQRSISPRRSAAKSKSEQPTRSAAREAILAALEHGSHTVSELAVVTAMSGPNLNGNLRRLFAEGAVVKAEREGKAAWALPDTAL